MILYHGTSTKFLKAILDRGIVPRKEHGNSVYKSLEFESRPDLVYLTDRYPMFYAALTCQYLGGKPVIIQVEVDETMLLPDEEFIGTILAQRTKKGTKRKRKSQTHEKKTILSVDPVHYQEHWKMSLDYMGTVATDFVHADEIVKALKVPDDIMVQMTLGLDTNPQAGARYGIMQSVFDQLPDRLPYHKALEIFFDKGVDEMMKVKKQIAEKFQKDFADKLKGIK